MRRGWLESVLPFSLSDIDERDYINNSWRIKLSNTSAYWDVELLPCIFAKSRVLQFPVSLTGFCVIM